MRNNMGITDRTLRVTVAAVIGILFLANILTGMLAAVGGLVALVFLITGIAGFCPLYTLRTAPVRPVQQSKDKR